ncbi:MAG: CBS domain-containing protein [Candidatus Geothermincolia bacterium]
MLVRDAMTAHPITLNPHDTLGDAMRLAQRHGFRRFPVVEKGRLVGIITDRDLRGAGLSTAIVYEKRYQDYMLDRIQVGGIMSRHPFTVTPDTPLRDAAALLLKEKIGGLPVTERDELVGVITETDVIRAFIDSAGS